MSVLRSSLVCVVLIFSGIPALAAEDILIADFEQETYGNWMADGEAFGPGPAKATLPHQMHVSGFVGERLVNSFSGGDNSTGTLTSPEFAVKRRYINFLVGGGKYPGETCINLKIDGKIVRTATGPNEVDGGSEHLDWHTWDVSDLKGKSVRFEIVDQRQGGWGHITVDHIVQSDQRRQEVILRWPITINKRYLLLPIEDGAKKRRLELLRGDEAVRGLDIELKDNPRSGKGPDWWAFIDVSEFAGEELVLTMRLPEGNTALETIRPSDDQPPDSGDYNEPLRPQFHFTSRRGWLNDPNGLVWHDGEWHLYYQHNPVGWNWGNMHWGHAVSSDLLHWREQGDVFHPWADTVGAAFSGSAVVDHANTSGFGTADNPPLVAALTDTEAGEIIAYSTDNGRTFAMHAGNPVVRHRGRDPKVMWHEPTQNWVMALYDEHEDQQWIAFYTSPDLKAWTFASRIAGFYECPDLFELTIDGDSQRSLWVLHAADGKYRLGKFDGRTFRPQDDRKHQLWYGNFYAAQSYDNAPGGRRIQIGWGRGITFPEMPFNQQMCIPVELTLRTTDEGVRMFAEPVQELAGIAEAPLKTAAGPTAEDETILLVDDAPELLDVSVQITPESAAQCGVIVRGQTVTCDIHTQKLRVGDIETPLPRTADGRVSLRILVDRGSIEVFAGGGAVAVSRGVNVPDSERSIAFFAAQGRAGIKELTIHPLRSVWRNSSSAERP